MPGEEEETAALLDGRYRLGDCVGEGGMARVYRAEDVTLGRTVAVKVMRPGIDGATSERARSEMTVLASLNHPSLVTLFDARLVPGQPEYLVMEFVDGPTLASRLAVGALPPAVVAHLAGELAEALHVVHRAGVVHRDIKPSNVLLSPPQIPGGRPRAKLADFGIAYLLDTARLTSPGLVIGTMAYLAPEQIRGGEPAAASDIYALGLVLLEALTGERAHPHGAGIDAVLARAETPPVIPVSLGAGWGDLLARMLAVDPSRRPTAAQVAKAAQRLATDASTTVPASASTSAATVPVTAPTLLAPAAGAGVAGVAALGGAAAAAAAAGPSAEAAPTAVLTDPGSPPPLAADRRTLASNPRRRRLLVVLAAVLVALVIGIGAAAVISSLGSPADPPQPAPTEPADQQPVEDEPAPAEDDTGVDDAGLTEEERKAAEEAAKKAEEEQKKLEREQKKQAEEERKQRDKEERDDD
ncbi:serine/threonine-protein kinase [Microbacterium sp. NPDC057407]|uniref:serine/threonine-protein kinase n=1 Tax=Microbacterium sp. NPDC057407 TaxID=3346120 RepID=UPI00366EC0DA